MLLDSIYHEKLLDCEKAEMAAWQECSSLVLIILSVDLPGHPKPGINSGGELRWPTGYLECREKRHFINT